MSKKTHWQPGSGRGDRWRPTPKPKRAKAAPAPDALQEALDAGLIEVDPHVSIQDRVYSLTPLGQKLVQNMPRKKLQ